jgi:diadenosine tetraphosphate (Ap4A) HIT family hydrolase
MASTFGYQWHKAICQMTSLMEKTEASRRVAHCPLCRLGDARLRDPRVVGDLIAVFADQDLVVFLQPPKQVVAVAPAAHVDGLLDIDSASLGTFLAALRQTALHVESVFGCSGTTIEAVDEVLPNANGHVCFHVIPSFQGDGDEQFEPSEPMAQALSLAKRFR